MAGLDDKLFECAVCLDTCNECINCLQCNQILCKAHAKNVSRCPICRDVPFRFQENVALQRIIRDLRTRAGITSPPRSPRESGSQAAAAGAAAATVTQAATGDGYTATLAAAATNAFWSAFGTSGEQVPANTRAEESIPDPEEDDLLVADPRFGVKIPCGGRREGQFKKVPNDDFQRTMKMHTRACTNEKCSHTWTGPWGTFIGGSEGSTHFDLTECREGKRLNSLTGWDYENPTC